MIPKRTKCGPAIVTHARIKFSMNLLFLSCPGDDFRSVGAARVGIRGTEGGLATTDARGRIYKKIKIFLGQIFANRRFYVCVKFQE